MRKISALALFAACMALGGWGRQPATALAAASPDSTQLSSAESRRQYQEAMRKLHDGDSADASPQQLSDEEVRKRHTEAMSKF